MGTFDKPRHRRGQGDSRHHQNSNHDPHAAGGPLRPLFARTDSHRGKPDYHTAALCKQVARILGMTLAGECGDPLLQSLIVDEVLPAPNAGRLLVRILVRADLTTPTANGIIVDTLHRLAAVHKLLRLRIGESIARKRTPELTFDVIPLAARPSNPDANVAGGAP